MSEVAIMPQPFALLHHPRWVRTTRLLALFLVAAPAAAQAPEPVHLPGLGALAFPNSGAAEAQAPFLRGMLALHSFWYEEARRSFREAKRIDPGFAMAGWGEALTWDHPVWGPQDARRGRRVLRELENVSRDAGRRWTDRERAYLEAAGELFGRGSLPDRRRRFQRLLLEIAEAHPWDDEAVAFHSLMVVANHDHRGGGREMILAAADELHAVLARNPEHPGAHHYLIHAYDHPDLVEPALPLAERYPTVAGAAPHAVHMPAHVYRQLGRWERVAETCKAAYNVSVRWVQREGLPETSRDFHSLRWLHTAYLRMGQLDQARELHSHMERIRASGPERRELDRIRASLLREYRRATR